MLNTHGAVYILIIRHVYIPTIWHVYYTSLLYIEHACVFDMERLYPGSDRLWDVYTPMLWHVYTDEKTAALSREANQQPLFCGSSLL